MAADKSWQFVGGGTGGVGYRLYDALRRGVNRRLVRFLVQASGGVPPRRVLEAGSGPAFATSLFAATPGVELAVALDLDLEALKLARQRDAGLVAVVGDLKRLPFRAGSFDLTWNSSTVEHLGDPGAALREMAGVTRPGGHVFVGVPYRFGPLGFEPWIRRTRVGVWIGPVHRRSELETLMRGAGLTPIAATLYFFLFFIGLIAQREPDIDLSVE